MDSKLYNRQNKVQLIASCVNNKEDNSVRLFLFKDCKYFIKILDYGNNISGKLLTEEEKSLIAELMVSHA